MKLLKIIFTVFAINFCFPTIGLAVSWSDVSIDLTVDEESVVGEPVLINIELENSGRLAPFVKVATNPVVTVKLPPGSSDIVSAECVLTDQSVLKCALPEIGVDEVVQISISVVMNNGGHAEIEASVNADDLLGGTASDSRLLTVLAQSVNSDPVDLGVELASSGTREVKIEGSEGISITVRNSHDKNTVYFPAVELTMGEELGFISGDNCSDVNAVVTCKIPMLAPQSETELFISLTGNTLSEGIPFIVSAVSTQPEAQSQDNVAELAFSIVEWEVLCGASNPSCFGGVDAPDEPDTDIANGSDNDPDTIVEQIGEATAEPVLAPAQEVVSSSDSGGGVLSVQLLFLLVLFSFGVLVRSDHATIK